MSGINVKFEGQWGNQAMQYCIAKILSHKTGIRYDPPASFLDKRGNPVVWSGEPLFVPQSTEGVGLDWSPPKRGPTPHLHWIDLDTVDPTKPIAGYFQRYELLQPFKYAIREKWLNIPADRHVATDPEAVYIHVRRTDFVDIGGGQAPDTTRQCSATTMDEYAACLKQFPDARRVVLVTDNLWDPFLSQFNRFGLPWMAQSDAWDIDFLTLASCKWLLISQSTFSWWAGFLGRAEKIVAPVFPGTYWGNGLGAIGADREEFPNLHPSDEPERWTWVTE